MATPAHSKSLQQALSSDRPPFCSGAISPSPEGLYLYYGKKKPRFIDFASVTSEDLDHLLAACRLTTSGHGKKDIRGESQRQVLEMDASDFIVRSDVVDSDLMRTIEDKLLQGKKDDKCIRAEPVRLNIYDKDSLFGAHRGAHRDVDRFGSLVVIYPTPYKGGEVILRHEDHEWKIDAKVLTPSQTSPSLAYVAFHSDVEHEVLKVTTGRRVTVTYDLYLVDPPWKFGAPAAARAQSVSSFQAALQKLLESPEFLPEGGILGFGLSNHYPFDFETELQEMASYLKGEDAHVYRICRELGLQPSLRAIYDDDRVSWGCEGFDGIMLDEIVQDICPDCEGGRKIYGSALVGTLGGIPVNKGEDVGPIDPESEEYPDPDPELITWISPLNKLNQLEGNSSAYERDGIFSYINPCIIARIAAACDRVDY